MTKAVQDPQGRRRDPVAAAMREGHRLTPRDHQMLALLADLRVATAEQLARVGDFPNGQRARSRLPKLVAREVLARFRPYQRPGSAPYHYTLGPVGAVIRAAATEAPFPTRAQFNRDHTRLQQSRTLAHRVGVVEFVSLLYATARRIPGAQLVDWLPEHVAARPCIGLVRPDGYGEWAEHTATGTRRLGFFYEYDTGSERLSTLVGKIDRYAQLPAQTRIWRNVLIQLDSATREANFHRALSVEYGPAGPVGVMVATTHTAQVHALGDPAGPIWWPAGTTRGRYRLTALPAHQPPPAR